MERRLDITINFDNEDSFRINIRDPETCLYSEYEFPFSPFEHDDFNRVIGENIYSWVSLWEAEEEDEYEYVDPDDLDDEDGWEYEDEYDEEWVE